MLRTMRCSLLLSLLAGACLLFAGSAVAQDPVTKPPPPPGEGGDAVLPAGYKNLRWGINDIALSSVLDRGMESAPGRDSHRHWLIDTPPTNQPDRGVVKFHFWDGAFYEVVMYYTLTAAEGKRLKERYEERYGPGTHSTVKSAVYEYNGAQKIAEEKWQWQDPFTVQILRRQLDGEKWSVVRQSRVLEDRRQAQERREREEKRGSKVDSIGLD